MAEIVKSPQYEHDLEGIWLWISRSSPAAADRTIKSIERVIAGLADFPGMGTLCDHLAPGLRRVMWREYLIYYSIAGDVVRVARVLHGRRNITPDMFQD